MPPPGRNRSVLLPAIHTFIIPTPIACIFRVLLPIVDTKLVPVAKTFFTMLTLKRPSVWFATYLNMQFIPALLSKNLFAILAYNCGIVLFRWFKFTLKPPYSIALDNLRLAIWDTSFWTFWLKFGHKGP